MGLSFVFGGHSFAFCLSSIEFGLSSLTLCLRSLPFGGIP